MGAAWLSLRAQRLRKAICVPACSQSYSSAPLALSSNQISASVWLLRAGEAVFRAGVVVFSGCCRDLFCFHHDLQARPGAVLACTVGAAAVPPCQAGPSLAWKSKSRVASGCITGLRCPRPSAHAPLSWKEGRWDHEIIQLRCAAQAREFTHLPFPSPANCLS